MNVLDKNGAAYDVTRYRLMLMLGGYELTRESKILDFGCGAGATVYAFRDEGFDARGFDIHDYLKLRIPEDRQFFDIAAAATNDKANYTVDWDDFRLPYPDETFDFIFSVTVMEHVQNHDAVLRELHRVTKHNGVNIHYFPPKWSLLEQHIFVPFGGAISHPAWYRLWATLGIRNQDQRQRGADVKETVALNVNYAATGLNYLPNSELHAIARRYFAKSAFVPDMHDFCSDPQRGIKFKHGFAPARWWHSAFRNIVWWLGRH